jgi:hypothetical protein
MEQGLEHVFWIGGNTCAGKSTVAALLAARFGFEIYHSDAHFTRHLQAAELSRQPMLYALQHDLRWNRWVGQLRGGVKARVWWAFYRQRFEMIVDDLKARRGKVIIAEGVDILPSEVIRLAAKERAAWLVPTRPFFEAHYGHREKLSDQADEETWSFYEAMIGRIRADTQRLGLKLIVVGDNSAPEIAEMLVDHFGL